MIWHFLEVWGLLLVAFALGGAIGTVLYMGLAVSPLADAQIAVADAIADRVDALRDLFGRRRDTGLYRDQREPPAFVMPLPIPAAPQYAGEDPEIAEDEAVAAHWPEPESLAEPVAQAEPVPATAVEEYWEDDEWAAAEEDARWPDDHYWAEDESAAAPLSPAEVAPGPAPVMPVEDHAETGLSSEPPLPAEETYGDDQPLAEDAEAPESHLAREVDGIPMPADAPSPSVDAEPTPAPVVAIAAGPGSVSSPEADPEPAAIDPAEDTAPLEALAAAAPVVTLDAEPEPSLLMVEVVDDVDSGGPEPETPGPFPASTTAAMPGDHGVRDGPRRPAEADVNEPEPEPELLAVAALPAASPDEIAGDESLPEVPVEAGVPPIPAVMEAPGRIPPRRAAAPKPEAAPDTALPSTRPLALAGPRNGVPDNLQRIRGVGHKNEELLNSLGIYHFGQIAAWTPAEARWVASQLAFPERLERDDWLGQAMVFATGGDTGYVKAPERRRKGDDDSSVAA